MARTQLLMDTLMSSSEEIDHAIKHTGLIYNALQESSNSSMAPFELLQLAIQKLTTEKNLGRIRSIYENILALFDEHPPIMNPICQELIYNCISHKVTISILSNTAFIPGASIKKYLCNIFGNDLFSFYLFSDEVNMAKPGHDIYSLCHQKVNDTHNKIINKTSILHLGDNYDNDYIGAMKYGFLSQLYSKDDEAK